MSTHISTLSVDKSLSTHISMCHISTLSVDMSLLTHMSMCHISTLSVDMSLDMSLCRYVSTYVSERPHTHTLTQNVCNLYNCRQFRKCSQIFANMSTYVQICRHSVSTHMSTKNVCNLYMCRRIRKYVDIFANISTLSVDILCRMSTCYIFYNPTLTLSILCCIG